MESYHEQERQAFLACIDENWDDPLPRLVYADWLEEHGEDEEAERQRKWNESKDWLVNFAKQWNFFDCTGNQGDYIYHNEYDWGDDRRYEHVPGRVFPDKEIIENLIEEGQQPDGYLTAGGIDLHSAGELCGDDKLFWEHLEIITGKRFSQAHKDDFCWSCSC